MPNILDCLGLEGSVLDGLAEWPASTTRKEWFAITRVLIQQTIAEMDLDPAACSLGKKLPVCMTVCRNNDLISYISARD